MPARPEMRREGGFVQMVSNKYGEVAIRAVQLLNADTELSSREAWNAAAADTFGPGTSSSKKGCPRGAFLGLCGAGLIAGVGRVAEGRVWKNAGYATRAVEELRRNPVLADNPRQLWAAVTAPETKTHNSQMDVVLALWQSGQIR